MQTREAGIPPCRRSCAGSYPVNCSGTGQAQGEGGWVDDGERSGRDRGKKKENKNQGRAIMNWIIGHLMASE